MENRIVAVDPGKTTGLAFFNGGNFMVGSEVYDYDAIRGFLQTYNPEVVVVEDYVVGRLGAHHRTPLMVMGAVEMICQDLEIPIVYQSPSILKIMLKRLDDEEGFGLNSPHVRSAAAHALYYITEGGRHAKPTKFKRKG